MYTPRTAPVAMYKGRSHTGSQQLEQKVAVPLMSMEEETRDTRLSRVCVFKVGFCVASCLQTSQISKDDFEHLILLLPPPQCWDDRHVPPYLAPKRYLSSAQMLEKNRGCDVNSYKFGTERQIDLADGLAD